MIGSVRLAWIAVLIPACYDTPRAGLACDNGHCPDGQYCNAQSICESGDASLGVPVDAAIDVATVDTGVCFGSIFPICFAAAPTTPLNVTADMKVDTSLAATCVATTSGGNGVCVVAATTITVDNAKLRGIGNKPLVLIASDSITITGANGEIDVGNRRADADLGAGANPTPPCMAGTQPTNWGNDGAGGGAGGSLAGTGGAGGGGGGGVGVGGSAPAGTPNVATLRGGCAGQRGGDNGGAGGRGGGVVYLVAGNRIEIAGRGVNAGGEGGGGATTAERGGGGGGSGGMIVLDAPTVTCTASLVANGGGGGEGSDPVIVGNPGSDATATAAANGGGDAVVIGGDGGPGSAGPAAGAGMPGSNGVIGAGGNDGGGGGGGGGAGLIKASAGASLGALVSPAATP